MIIIKDKMRNTEVFVPRSNDFDTADYVTEQELTQNNDTIKSFVNANYATKEFVEEILGDINNVLEEIIN